ncbi:MAG: hypothetical protein LBH46_02470 [Rickettsiales bacterium]|jgi:hypothetical protein|nr:hypothetical protein [Rickettsiales bacterium]
MTEERLNTIYNLTIKKIIFLFVLYIILFVIGVIASSIVLTFETNDFKNYSLTSISLIGGFSIALVGNTIFYIRKLYKLCINNAIKQTDCIAEEISEIGIFVYLVARPLFAVGFSLLIQIALKSSISFVSVGEVDLNTNFLYLVMLLSFFGGFAAGDFLTFLEEKSKKVINEKIKF